MAYVAPITWTTGQIVTAAEMNQDVRDNVAEVYGRVNAKTTMINCAYWSEPLVADEVVPIQKITIPAASYKYSAVF